MAGKFKATIGFVSGGAGSMPHYNSFLPLIPEAIKFDFTGLELYNQSLYEIADKKGIIVQRVKEMVTARNWDGVILTAAPTEVLNPGLFDDLTATLAVPFTTALHACVAALRLYGARRVLLLTPFDGRLNELICGHLQKHTRNGFGYASGRVWTFKWWKRWFLCSFFHGILFRPHIPKFLIIQKFCTHVLQMGYNCPHLQLLPLQLLVRHQLLQGVILQTTAEQLPFIFRRVPSTCRTRQAFVWSFLTTTS